MKLQFGIEIEFFNVHYETVISELRAAGIQVADYNGYTHAVIPQWKVTTDASVTGVGTGVFLSGLELVSPILYGDEGLEELELVYEVLTRIGAQVDKTCGTHVHFDISTFSTENVKSFINLFYKYQSVTKWLVPKSRRDNSYCSPINKRNIDRINSDIVDNIASIAHCLGDRYRTINLFSYVKYGTIEIRQHGGTLEFEKIEAWIVLMYQMLNHAEHNVVEPVDRPRVATNKGLHELFGLLNLEDTYVADYLQARYNHFKEVV